jgi:uncharacterized membrane protein YqhA
MNSEWLGRALAASRFLLVLPVVGCVLLTAGTVLMGVGRIFKAGAAVFRTGEFSLSSSKAMGLAVIEIIDLFLVATVAYITAVGLHKLFISGTELKLPMKLKIESLQHLEEKIIGVIVAALAVAFLGKVTSGDDPEALLATGGGIALVVAALGVFMRMAAQRDSRKQPD